MKEKSEKIKSSAMAKFTFFIIKDTEANTYLIKDSYFYIWFILSLAPTEGSNPEGP